MPDEVPPQPVATVRTIQESTIPAGWPGAVVVVSRFLGGLTTERALIYFLMIFIGFFVWSDRTDRKENAAADRRSTEDIQERNRQASSEREEKTRTGNDARLEKVLSHCAQDNKDARTELKTELQQIRTAIHDFTKEIEQFRRMLKGADDETLPVPAPMPRKKKIVDLYDLLLGRNGAFLDANREVDS